MLLTQAEGRTKKDVLSRYREFGGIECAKMEDGLIEDGK